MPYWLTIMRLATCDQPFHYSRAYFRARPPVIFRRVTLAERRAQRAQEETP